MSSASTIGFTHCFLKEMEMTTMHRLGIKYTFRLKKSIWTFSALQAKCCSNSYNSVIVYRSCFLITEFQDINYLVEWRLSLHYLLALLVSMLLCSTKTGNCNRAPMVCDLLKDIWRLSLSFLVVGYFSLKIARGHAHNRLVILLLIITITKLSNLIGYQLPWFQP